MPKIVAMIPARLGSKRIKRKNLRLLAGKPLVCHVIEKAKEAGVFAEIYINSEADIFREIAKKLNVKFYKRDKSLASDNTTNDMFVLDFIQNVKCGIIIQINPTSPLISAEDIKAFVKRMIEKKYDTLHSIKKEQIEAIYNRKPLNFDPLHQMRRSQDLAPIFLFSSAIMGWRTKKYFENIRNFNSATYGGNSKIGYFILKGFSTIDIDDEEDFEFAEEVLKYSNKQHKYDKRYHQSKKNKKYKEEIDVSEILKTDNVIHCDFAHENLLLVNVDKIISSKNTRHSWCHRVINTESNSATLIAQLPGEGNRLHFHPDWDEWWYIVKGTWKGEIEGKKFILKKGDIIFLKRNKRHKITAIGDELAIRLSVNRDQTSHMYPGKDTKNEH